MGKDYPPIRAAGGIVFCTAADGATLLLLIQDKQGFWTLPKGRIEPGETEEEAAQREIAEETGIDATIGPLVRRIQYSIFKQRVWRDKTVVYFLGYATHRQPAPCREEGIGEACWFDPSTALLQIGYAQVRKVVMQALAMNKPM